MSIVDLGARLTIIQDLNLLGKYIKDFNQTNRPDIFLKNIKKLADKTLNSNYPFIIRNDFGTKITRSFGDPLMNKFLNTLDQIPEIKHKNILYDSRFIESFYNIIWPMLQGLGYSTQNFYDFILSIVDIINRITTVNYIIYDCRSTDIYNCGRAMIPLDLPPSKFLVFNTDDNTQMDLNVQMSYITSNENPQCLDLKEIDETQLKQYHPRYYKRILKEIKNLTSEYQIKIVEGVNILLKHKTLPIQISLALPSDYPNSAPSGIFNGLTISDVDTKKYTWSPISNMKTIIDRLVTKYNNEYFKKHLLVPTRVSYEKICNFK